MSTAAKGYKGYMLLTKPGEDTAMAVTLWETEVDMENSERIAQAMIPELRSRCSSHWLPVRSHSSYMRTRLDPPEKLVLRRISCRTSSTSSVSRAE